MTDELEELKAKRSNLESELRQVKEDIYIREKARRPRATQNDLILIEGEPFWAIGYRNSIYEQGHWRVRFTNEERRAKRLMACSEYRSDGTNRLFRLIFPGGEVSKV